MTSHDGGSSFRGSATSPVRSSHQLPQRLGSRGHAGVRGAGVCHPEPRALGVRDAPNPFGLHEDDQADVILLTSYWHNWLTTLHPDRVSDVMRVLAGSATAIVGLDGTDCFELGFGPRALSQLTTIIKFQGVFRDRDLYKL